MPVLFRPFSAFRIEAAEDVEVVVEDCEAADVLGEDFEPGFDPGLAVRHAFATQESPPDAAGNAVVVARDRDVHQLPPGHRHRWAPAGFPGTERPYPTAPAAGRQGLCLSSSSRTMPFLLVSPRAEARPAVGAADRGGGAVAVAVEVEAERRLEAGDAAAAHHADAHAEDRVAVRERSGGDGHLAQRSGGRQGLCLSLCGYPRPGSGSCGPALRQDYACPFPSFPLSTAPAAGRQGLCLSFSGSLGTAWTS